MDIVEKGVVGKFVQGLREDSTSTLHPVSTQPPPYLHPAYTVKRLSGGIGVVPDPAKTPNRLLRSAPSRLYRCLLHPA